MSHTIEFWSQSMWDNQLWQASDGFADGYNFSLGTISPVGNASLLTFTRTGAVSTNIKSDGLMEVVGPNIPRFMHDPLTGVTQGILIERGATNLLQYPEALDNAVWDAPSTNGVVTPNVATDQFGSLKFDRLASDGTNDRRRQTLAHTSGTSRWYGHGAVAKSGTSKVFEIRVGLEGGTTPVYTTVQINVSTGVVTRTEGTGEFGAIEFQGHYRLWCGVIDNGTGNTSKLIQPRCATAGQSVDIGAFQLEQNQLSTYIPSDGPQVSRSADILSGPIALDPNGAYSAMIEAISPRIVSTSFERVIELHDGTNSNSVLIYRSSPGGNALALQVINGGVVQAGLTLGDIAPNTLFRVAFAVRNNDVAAVITGGTVLADTSAIIPAITTLNVGATFANTAQFGGIFRSIKQFPGQRLSNTELLELVTL